MPWDSSRQPTPCCGQRAGDLGLTTLYSTLVCIVLFNPRKKPYCRGLVTLKLQVKDLSVKTLVQHICGGGRKQRHLHLGLGCDETVRPSEDTAKRNQGMEKPRISASFSPALGTCVL